MGDVNDGNDDPCNRIIGKCIVDAVRQICGGSMPVEELSKLTLSSISFTNKTRHDVEGKPHNVEIKTALSLYHKTRKRKRETKPLPYPSTVELISDLGLKRTIASPVQLAQLLCNVLNQDWDVRVNTSGILYLVTADRSQALRNAGRLPCSYCTKWCKGEKGLWWHQQREHGTDHAAATERAASERSVLAIVSYNPEARRQSEVSSISGMSSKDIFQSVVLAPDDIFELARDGNIDAIREMVQHQGLDITDTWDRKGASPLHWAAGSGQLELVRYLVDDCHCDPNVGQRGKRSFSGRTALHWAARNGRLPVVMFLVKDCASTNIDATTIDGTCAFGWACWQGHLEVMKYLHVMGCNVHKTNSFGCNAVLWCAQGEGANRVEAIQWLHSIDCHMTLVNSNGHGALHKVAQRGRADVVDWLVSNAMESDGTVSCTFEWIGPDGEGCCPSDLAGMEGHVELAGVLSNHETTLASILCNQDSATLPVWLQRDGDNAKFASNAIWEPWGGVRRLRQHIHGCR